MPRAARRISSTGIYHILLRGADSQPLFIEEEDKRKFLQTLADCKKISGFELYAYCLMENHVHLLLKEGKEKLELIFKRIGSRYVYWYNYKYGRSGHLFQDRFKSEVVEKDGFFIAALRHIHQNPKKAGLCESIEDYKWSSYNDYFRKAGFIDCNSAFEHIDEGKYPSLMRENADDHCMDVISRRVQDNVLIEEIEKKYRIKAMSLQNEPRAKMEQILHELLKMEGVSTRQLSRVTGVPVNTIWRL